MAMDFTGGLFEGSPNWGKLAQANEKKRQGIIDLGLNQINAVYGGGSAPFYTLAGNDPYSKAEWRDRDKSQSLYSIGSKGKFGAFVAPKKKDVNTAAETGNLYGGGVGGVIAGAGTGDLKGAAMSAAFGLPGQMKLMGGLFGDDDPPTVRELVNKKIKQGQLFNAPEMKSFEGFQPEFFEKRAQDYVNYALPQFADQYQQSRNNMLYSLANRGLSSSSVATSGAYNLEKTAGQGKQQIADEGLGQANQLKRDVEQSRQNSIAQLYQSADPAQALQSALGAASQFRQPSVFQPLTNMFQGLAQQYYTNRLMNQYQQGANGVPNSGYSLSGSLGPVYSKS
jgi:hypothetical protein